MRISNVTIFVPQIRVRERRWFSLSKQKYPCAGFQRNMLFSTVSLSSFCGLAWMVRTLNDRISGYKAETTLGPSMWCRLQPKIERASRKTVRTAAERAVVDAMRAAAERPSQRETRLLQPPRRGACSHAPHPTFAEKHVC